MSLNNEKSKLTPAVRTVGFTGDWEQRKWIDTVDMSTNMVDPKTGKYDKLLHIGPGNIESFTGRILDNVNTVKDDNLISGKFHFNPNDIIYGKINPQLAKYTHVNFEGLASADAYVLNSKNGITQDFLYVELQTSGFYKYSVSVSMRTGMPKINRDELNQFSYLAPKNIEEQQKIGSFFKQLDDTITFHQRKLSGLQQARYWAEQNLLPEPNETAPKVRVGEFDGEWKSTRLSDVANRITRKNTELESTLPLTISAQFGLVDQRAFFNKSVASADVNGYYLVNKGEFAYNHSTSNDAPMGAIKRLDNYEAGVLSTLYIVFKPTETVDSDFLVAYFNSNCWYPEVAKVAAAGARAHGLINVAPAQFMGIQIKLPETIQEQQAIAKVFTTIDARIKSEQQLIADLQEVKRWALNNMFI